MLICVRLCACARERLTLTDKTASYLNRAAFLLVAFGTQLQQIKLPFVFPGMAFCSQVQSLFAAVEPLKMQSGPNQRWRTKVGNNGK